MERPQRRLRRGEPAPGSASTVGGRLTHQRDGRGLSLRTWGAGTSLRTRPQGAGEGRGSPPPQASPRDRCEGMSTPPTKSRADSRG